jgi:hypothetical protein
MKPRYRVTLTEQERQELETLKTGRTSAKRFLAYPVCCQSYYRVSPLAAVECLVGRCRGMCRESQDRVECRHWIETPVEAEHKFVEVSL